MKTALIISIGETRIEIVTEDQPVSVKTERRSRGPDKKPRAARKAVKVKAKA
jgi:hypothetical protein|tara:strand:+ start:227 stop:382 length:156 start_codon:yes stop_codon:yes gene_type:complete